MTKTDTADIVATVRQMRDLNLLGCEVIRVAVKDRESARAISQIKKRISMPLEADIHFDYRLAVLSIESGADGIRLNPGNIKNIPEIKKVIMAARIKDIPIRIGVNSGSLPDTGQPRRTANQAVRMVRLANNYLKIFEKEKFYDIMISLKASDLDSTIKAYRLMARDCCYPFHLGVTAAGAGMEGVIKSAVGISALLREGIGDTIRVSLTDTPQQEVIAAKYILQSLGLRRFGPEIISCPTCGRCQVDLCDIVKKFKDNLSAKRYPLNANKISSIAIMGCEVNGPGEAKEADIGIAFGKGSGVLFKKGKVIKKVKAKNAVRELLNAVISG
jgi:(E)-4-hydroxy-3-methylbut-2-enyl-diphosphate synthase